MLDVAEEAKPVLSADATEQLLRSWLNDNVGSVTALNREGRWRPAWFAETETPEGPKRLYIRGAREGRWPPRPLAYEARAHSMFEANGLNVPHIFGYIDAIPAIVMERVAGRPNLATAESDEARQRIREQLADQMRCMHELDPALLLKAGARMPDGPEDITLSAYREVERIYLEGDRLPSPGVEFVRRWIDRNVPPCEEPACIIAMDAGQFIFEGDELTAMLDFEFVCLGDRHIDFAALRTREKIEGFADVEQFYDLYEARGGKPIDIDRVRFQHIAFSLFTPLEIAHDLAHPRDALDYHEYLIWQIISMKDALEGIAEAKGIRLQKYETAPAAPGRYRLSLEALERMVGSIEVEGEFAGYQRDKIALTVRYLLRGESCRDRFEQDYIADVMELTGVRASSSAAASADLEAFVLASDPDEDERILRVLHRDVQREASILADEGTWLHESLTTPLRPLARPKQAAR